MKKLNIRYLQRNGYGNLLGLAYDTEGRKFYLSHSSHSGSKSCLIYIVDIDGNKKGEIEFSSLVKDSRSITSLSYRNDIKRLFVGYATDVLSKSKLRVAEISSDGKKIFSDISLDIKYSNICVSDKGIWSTIFPQDKLSLFNYDGGLETEISLSESFGGYPGPGDLARSFDEGLFIVDHYRKMIIEVDEGGKEICAYSTSSFGDGRGVGIATNLEHERLFLSVNNEAIFEIKKEKLRTLLAPAPEDRPKENKKSIDSDPIDVSKLMDPKDSPWTRAKAKKFILSILNSFRNDLHGSYLNKDRLPKWVESAHVRFGWIRNSLIFVIDDSGTSKDSFNDLGQVNADTVVLLGLSDFLPEACLNKLPEKIREFKYQSYGHDEKSQKSPVIVLSPKVTFLNCGYMKNHGPIGILDICFRIDSSDPESRTLAMRKVQAAFYVAHENLNEFDKTVKWIKDSLFGYLEEINMSKKGEDITDKNYRIKAIEVNKEKSVLVLGSYSSKNISELYSVRDYLINKDYDANLIIDLPKIQSMSLTDKVELWAKAARFSVMIDRNPSGHISEYETLKVNRSILALLRKKGKKSTSMIGTDHLVDINYFKLFEFNESPIEVLDEAVGWAESIIKKREESYGNEYS
jgi:hypothetical protein